MSIWSKAPKGATQYDTLSVYPWEKIENKKLYFFTTSGIWCEIAFPLFERDLIYRPLDQKIYTDSIDVTA